MPVTAQDEARAAWERSVKPVLGGNSIRELRRSVASLLAPKRNAYRGGDRALRFLVPKPGEKAQKWQLRQHLFRDVPLTSFVANSHARYLYKQAPRRTWWVGEVEPNATQSARQILRGETVEADPVSAALASFVRDIYEANHHDSLMMRGARLLLRDALACLKVVPRIETDDPTIMMDWMGTLGEISPSGKDCEDSGIEDAWPIVDPDDWTRVLGTIETRGSGDDVAHWLHTPEMTVRVNDALESIEDELENPLGLLMFVYLGDGTTVLDRILPYHRAAINKSSTLDAVTMVQGFSQPVARGPVQGEVVEDETGKKHTRSSDSDILEVEINGDFFYARPDAPLDELDAQLDRMKTEGIEICDLPKAILSGDLGAVQPHTLRLMFQGTVASYQERVTLAQPFEDETALLVAAIADEWRGEFGLPGTGWRAPDRIGERGDGVLAWRIEFPASPIPSDDDAKRVSDQQDTAAGRMLLEDYVAKWILPGASGQAIADYVQALQAQRQPPAFEAGDGPPIFRFPSLDSEGAEGGGDRPTRVPGQESGAGESRSEELAALSLLAERLGRIGDVALLNVARQRIAELIGAGAVPEITSDQLLVARGQETAQSAKGKNGREEPA